jgi:hypothetical protein
MWLVQVLSQRWVLVINSIEFSMLLMFLILLNIILNVFSNYEKIVCFEC